MAYGGDLRHSVEVIEYPENYEEMKKKYLEREEENLKRALERRNVESPNELANVASKAISTRMQRAALDHKPLKDRTILREAKSEEIQDLKQKLSEEITLIGQRIFKEFPKYVSSLEEKIIGLKALKGRISQSSSTVESDS